uniref:Electron transporter n=1 Tax=Kalanchoe fedtschenkoi TaxID=63787 RepID=A0A7N0UEH6_KALFE
MGFEGVGGVNLTGLSEAPKLNRSKSCPDSKRFQEDKFGSLVEPEESRRHQVGMGKVEDLVRSATSKSPSSEVHHESLKQEILLLEKRLRNQFEVRHALESALGYRSSSSNDDDADATPIPRTATELIRDIAVLEYEVGHLEQYLLSLYRKAFDQRTPSSSPSVDKKVIDFTPPSAKNHIVECGRPAVSSSQTDSIMVKSRSRFISDKSKEPRSVGGAVPLVDSKARCQSSISQHSVFMPRSTPDDLTADEIAAKAVRACHSQPLSMTEYAQNTSANLVSLAEHLGTRISDHLPETPNRLSEDMIKCMSAIYCKLSDPPLTHMGLSSPNSTPSSMSQFSPRDHGDLWSPGFRKDSSFNVSLDNPFHVDGLKEFSGPYSTMVEVPWIYRDSQKLGDIEYLLQNFRSIISRLQEVDPRKLTHEEKLAFWINIHNSLAFLAFGIPQNNVKRVLLLLKAAYNIGGHTINADTIQSSILGCRMSRPGQWIRKLIPSRLKFKTGDERQAYAIDNPEPLLYFALSSGNHSDPAVRAYTPKRIFQELETAKDEYIRATFGIRKDRKIILPKLVESFSKDSGLSQDDLLKTIQQSLPESLRRSIKKSHASNRSPKAVEWIPHNFSFRYLVSKDLVKY